MAPDLDTARRKLEAHLSRQGLKHTRQRQAILEAFLGHEGHVTSEELYQLVREDHPEIGAATVYRALKLLCDAGIATPSNFRDGVTVYEHRLSHHDHLICIGCSSIVEFECDLIEDAQVRIADEYGFVLTSHRHELYGYCAKCRKKGLGQH